MANGFAKDELVKMRHIKEADKILHALNSFVDAKEGIMLNIKTCLVCNRLHPRRLPCGRSIIRC